MAIDEVRPERRGPRARLGMALLVLGVFALALIPRAFDLDRVVTPDEPLWLARSANFSEALASGDLAATYQYVHPGVTVMWLGALGLRIGAPHYTRDAPGYVRQRGNVIEGELRRQELDPLRVLVRCREVLAVAVAVVIALTALFAARLLGVAAALAGTALLALDPFHIALSRLLHLDGLFSCLLTLAACAWLVYLDRGQKRDLIAAGVALGLAGLTRSVAVVILPLLLASLFWARPPLATGTTPRRVWARVRPAVALAAIALATVVIGWPALWTNPIGTISAMVDGTLALGGRAHEGPIFFDGQIYVDADPGAHFYPISILWRATPALVIGLLLAGVVLVRAARRRPLDRGAVTALHLMLLALSVLALLTLSAKKFDRYAVPVVPALALVAGWGWVAAVQALIRARRPAARRSGLALALVGVLLLVAVGRDAVRVHPYGLAYYDPLMGGGSEAPAVMMVGWGEGLDQIARTVDALPDAPDLAIGTAAWSASLSYYLHRAEVHTVRLDDPATALPLLLTQDYFVRYITADQRDYVTPEVQAYLDGLTPVVWVRLDGIDYAALYDLRGEELPADFVATRTTPIAPGVRLLLAETPIDPVLPGTAARVRLYCTGTPAAGGAVPVRLALRAADGTAVATAEDTLPDEPGARTVWRVRIDLAVPADLPAGTYTLTAAFGPVGADAVRVGPLAVTGPGSSGLPAATPEA